MNDTKILIVDDDPDFVKTLAVVLEGAHYVVVTASDREEGLEKVRTDRPDLIILDVMMSTWQDGFEMSRELKKDPELKDIPILMLTAVEERSGIGFKSTAGEPTWLPVNGFLDKPVEPRVLLAEVERLLPKKV
ncbi:MAG: response regulator [Planctomycetota bacterium]|jgi:CheY-like chemotaxis protein